MSAPDVWEEVVVCRRAGRPAALATIVSTLGSTPGKDPMKMLVRDDGTFVGSVGGGCLEAEVWEHARTVMASHRAMSVRFTLTEEHYPDSGLICGGTVTVFIEPVTPPTLHVFGAGHVGAATARLAASAGFRVLVHDDRPDVLAEAGFTLSPPEAAGGGRAGPTPAPAEGGASDPASPPACPESARSPPPVEGLVHGVSGDWEDALARHPPGPAAFVVVVTRGHHDDGRVLKALAEADVRPRFLGMIGSRAKRKVLLARLAAEGVGPDWLDRIVSPVGLPIGARTAAEIAVSIVAQLIAEVRVPDGEGRPDALTPRAARQ